MAENDFSQYPDIEELLSKPRPSEKDALKLEEIKGVYDIVDIVGEKLPDMPEVLIDNIMRTGGIMTITAASKAGKSMLTYELSIALAMGWEWLGCRCKVSKTLYCDFENDYREGANRYQKIIDYRHIDPKKLQGMIYPYYPDGKFIHNFDEEKKRIAILAKEKGVNVIVLDSVYNLLGDLDENAAGDMSKLFADVKELGTATDCSVVLIHHFSKGSQSSKSAMDRGSGSGVFARAPSAILSIEELEMTDELAQKLFERYGTDVSDGIAFKVESVLRSFKRPDPIYGVYCYPIHMIDYDAILAEARTMDVARTSNLRKELNKRVPRDYDKDIENAYQKIIMNAGMKYGEMVQTKLIAEEMNVKEKTVINNVGRTKFTKQGDYIKPRANN